MTDRILGVVVIWFAALTITLALRYRGMPGGGHFWLERDKHPLLYWFEIAFVGLVGGILGFAFLLKW